MRIDRLKYLAPAVFIALSVSPAARAQVNVTVNASSVVRFVDDRMFALNTAVWDNAFTDTQTLSALNAVNVRFLRFPGGSTSDDYNWQTGDLVEEGTGAGPTTFDEFAASALAIGAQVVITTNYGTGTPQEAADWVTYSNVTKGYGFKYWEVGNECYGTWEDDQQSVPHDGYTYATRAVQYIQAMKAVDPTIKIGVVADASEDSYANGTTRSVTNPVTGVAHSGFTPVMLATMKSLGVLPDFVIYHNYAQNPGNENDAALLQYSLSWTGFATTLRGIVNDYVGAAAGANIELLCTENNSVSTNPGKQSTSLVNALFMADSVGSLMQTEFNSLVWWDLHNGPGTGGNNSSSLYGWRLYGDYGIENGDTTSLQGSTINLAPHDPYPTYYVQKLLTHFARGGDKVVSATSSSTLLTTYAAARQNGSLSLLVINKSPTTTYSANFAVTGFTPQANATAYSYGIPQDENSEENSLAASAPASGFSWENSLDGWVNQSGQPDTSATNYGLDAPFLYSLSFSQTTGVTSGSYSLECTTTAANPGDSAVIQNSTASIGTALSAAASVSVDIYPQIAAGSMVQASIYINGINIPYVLLGTVTLNPNQENTATFTLTDAQRSGILASLGSGNWFQVGINISAPAPITVYFDNFIITPLVAPTPTPTPTPIAGAASSPDIAVTSITNAGASFSASFAPYSATVISLNGPTSAPVATLQPASQTIASGSTVVFNFGVTGAPAPTYQWYLNGAAVPSATESTLVISGTTAANAGTYSCIATNASGSVTSAPAVLDVVSTTNPGRLINISCRAPVGTGGNILIAGFAVGGAGTSGTESLLIRASGPALAISPFSLTGTLSDPQLQLYSGTTVDATNIGWAGSPAIATAASNVGAFPWGNTSSHDAALLETLGAGPYTAQISGESGDTGIALAEVYDETPSGSYTPATPRLINISARVAVGTGGNILIAGFYIGGTTAKTILIRASGPALAAFSVPGTLSDPQLQLYQSNSNGTSTLLYTNNGWAGNAQIASTASVVGAFPWSDASSHDSALLVTLPPGGYTAQVSGASGDTGISLVEVYDVQ